MDNSSDCSIIEATLRLKMEAILQLNVGAAVDLDALLTLLRDLRNLCTRGEQIQLAVVQHNEFCGVLQRILFDEDSRIPLQLHSMALQLLANTVVANKQAQQVVWQRFGPCIMKYSAQAPLGRHTDILLMIVYNVFSGQSNVLSEQCALEIAVRVWATVLAEKCDRTLEFLHFLFEHFLVRNSVRYYIHLTTAERIAFLDYLARYLRQESPNGLVNSSLLQHIAKDFRMRSDCVMRQEPSDVTSQQKDPLHPREAYTLLRVIACASGTEHYAGLYASDHALFLNVSSLLRFVMQAGKSALPNQFTPMNKLEEVALNSKIASDFESKVSFELKTLLVRCTANLLYQNPTNQNYCRDTQLMTTLFECTNMDARNPLMKEWSILAIRNACVDCPANQEVIANLTKQGDATNNLINDLNLEMGSLRIQQSME